MEALAFKMRWLGWSFVAMVAGLFFALIGVAH